MDGSPRRAPDCRGLSYLRFVREGRRSRQQNHRHLQHLPKSSCFPRGKFRLNYTPVVLRCVGLGAVVKTYRRGFKGGAWETIWHWMDQCDDFPRGTCVLQRDQPADDALCPRCKELSQKEPAAR